MTGRTPAGARLEIGRGTRYVTIVIDRWPIDDASPEQAAIVDRLRLHAAGRCFAQGRRKAIYGGGGRVIWTITAPREDERAVLEALLGVERGDYAPAYDYLRLSAPRACSPA